MARDPTSSSGIGSKISEEGSRRRKVARLVDVKVLSEPHAPEGIQLMYKAEMVTEASEEEETIWLSEHSLHSMHQEHVLSRFRVVNHKSVETAEDTLVQMRERKAKHVFYPSQRGREPSGDGRSRRVKDVYFPLHISLTMKNATEEENARGATEEGVQKKKVTKTKDQEEDINKKYDTKKKKTMTQREKRKKMEEERKKEEGEELEMKKRKTEEEERKREQRRLHFESEKRKKQEEEEERQRKGIERKKKFEKERMEREEEKARKKKLDEELERDLARRKEEGGEKKTRAPVKVFQTKTRMPLLEEPTSSTPKTDHRPSFLHQLVPDRPIMTVPSPSITSPPSSPLIPRTLSLSPPPALFRPSRCVGPTRDPRHNRDRPGRMTAMTDPLLGERTNRLLNPTHFSEYSPDLETSLQCNLQSSYSPLMKNVDAAVDERTSIIESRRREENRKEDEIVIIDDEEAERMNVQEGRLATTIHLLDIQAPPLSPVSAIPDVETLIHACLAGEVDRVRRILKSRRSKEFFSYRDVGVTEKNMLHWMAYRWGGHKKGAQECVWLLLQKQEELPASNAVNMLPLFWQSDDRSMIPLVAAITEGHSDLAGLFISGGSPLDIPCGPGPSTMTPLIAAMRKKDYKTLMRLARLGVVMKADVNEWNGDGESVLQPLLPHVNQLEKLFHEARQQVTEGIEEVCPVTQLFSLHGRRSARVRIQDELPICCGDFAYVLYCARVSYNVKAHPDSEDWRSLSCRAECPLQRAPIWIGRNGEKHDLIACGSTNATMSSVWVLPREVGTQGQGIKILLDAEVAFHYIHLLAQMWLVRVAGTVRLGRRPS